MEILGSVLLILALILLNGVFVAAEFAVVSAPRLRIDARAAAGHRIARVASRILHDPRRQDRLIATAQLGITLASLGLGMYGEHVIAEWILHGLGGAGFGAWVGAHATASVIAVVALTYLHIVLGEMVPKSLALQYAQPTLLSITVPMLWTQALFYPLVLGLNELGNVLLRLFRVDRRHVSAESLLTTEELRFVTEESEKAGALGSESGRLLRELLELGDLTAGRIMVPRVRMVTLPVGLTPERMASLLDGPLHTRYPVARRDLDDIVGFVHLKDLLRAVASNRPLATADARPLPAIPQTMTLSEAFERMRGARTQIVIVIDEHGGTAGLMTLEDIVGEVMGEVTEGAPAPQLVRTDDAGRLRVPV